MTIAERIFSLLEAQSKKQGDLAKYIGVRPATLSDWKAKRTSPASDLLRGIAEFFGVSVDYLVTGHEPAAVINQGIIGNQNTNNTITINGDAPRALSDIELELIRVCGNLEMRKKNALLSFAYELEEGKA